VHPHDEQNWLQLTRITNDRSILLHHRIAKMKLKLILAALAFALSLSAHADNYALLWGTAPDGSTPLYLDGGGGLKSPEASAFLNNGWYYEGYLRLDGRGELVAINRDHSINRYWIAEGRFELEPPPPPPKYNLSNVKNLLKVGTRLSRSAKPGVVVKSNANGVSIKWKKDKVFLLDSSTEVISYSYQEVVDYLNNGGFELQ
jgi:hypothetical protein